MMSFSRKVKEELSRHVSPARHCQLAELSAIYSCCGREESYGDKSRVLVFDIENPIAVRKCFTLLKKSFNIYSCAEKEDCENTVPDDALHRIEIEDENISEKIVSALKSNTVTQNMCCKRAYLRGSFLCSGSVSDPERSYHLEFVLRSEEEALHICSLLKAFDITAKVMQRKKHYIAYVKEGSQIVDLLNVMEAHVALMDFENSRILKDMRNSINRRVNCETANINKTVSAAVKQTEAIELLKRTEGYEKLPGQLKEIAQLRVNFPEATLKELGEMCEPPVGKSGVNHRLKKLIELAEEI